MKYFLSLLGSLVFIGIVAAAGIYFWFLWAPASSLEQEIVFEVSPSDPYDRIADRLAQQGMVKSNLLFKVYGRLTGVTRKVKAGEYLIKSSMTPNQVIAVITSGKSVTYPFTVSEGLNIYEIAGLFEKAGYGTKEEFLELCFDGEFSRRLLGESLYSLEGYLFPETYQLPRRITARRLIETMVKAFLATYDEIQSQNLYPHWSRHQIVTLASIIEKETGAPYERPVISAVFHNRLNKKMRLQTDPTVMYGVLDETKQFRMNITRQDLRTPTKYNTYTNSGLPHGPIANPGREALLAAMRPEASPYLFFVSRNDGTHIFTETYAEHKKAVQEYQLNLKAREGKSWRDLKKRAN